MKKHIFVLLLLSAFNASAQVLDNPYYLPENICESPKTCSEEISELATKFWQLRGKDDHEVTRIYYSGEKTPYVFVFLHGTFEDSRLFAYNAINVFSKKYNAIDIVLPGHGADYKSGFEMNYEQWFIEAKKLIRLSQFMGDKVILVTHSLGSLIALDMALTDPTKIDALVMVEPALSPHPVLTHGACAARYVIEDGRMFLPIVKYLGIRAFDRPIPLKVGCEVGKVPYYLIKKYLGVGLNFEDQKTLKQAAEAITDLALELNTRVLMVNNERDRVVDPEVNTEFFENLKLRTTSLYVGLKLSTSNHGHYLYTQNYDFQQLLLQYLDIKHDRGLGKKH